MADVPAEWKNNPQGYAIYLAESAKAAQANQQANQQVQQAQQQFQQSQQRQSLPPPQQQAPSSGPSQRYLDIQKQYQQQKNASVGSSGTMYKTDTGEYQYVSGSQAGQTFQVNVQQPLSVNQQGQSASQFAQEQATQQVMGNFLGSMQSGLAKGRIEAAAIQKQPSGPVADFFKTAARATETQQYKELNASPWWTPSGGLASLVRGGAEISKVLVQPQEKYVPLKEGNPFAEGQPLNFIKKSNLPPAQIATFIFEPKERASAAKFREENELLQARQLANAGMQAQLVKTAKEKGWINPSGTIETPNTPEGVAFAKVVNKSNLQMTSTNAYASGLFSGAEKVGVIQKAGDQYKINPANQKTQFDLLQGNANKGLSSGFFSVMPKGSRNALTTFRQTAEIQATLQPTNPAFLAGAFGAGAVEEIASNPATALGSLALGGVFGGATKAVGLAGRAAGFSEGAAGVRGIAARVAPKAVGVLMGGMYAADIGMRVGAEPTTGCRISKLGGITSTEIIPMGIGFGIGYKAVELGAPKVRAGYDLIKGTAKGDQNIIGRVRSVGEGVKSAGGRMNPESGMAFPPKEQKVKPAFSSTPQEHIPTIDLTKEIDVRPTYNVAGIEPKPLVKTERAQIASDLFKERGVNLSPAEAEAALKLHNAFGEEGFKAASAQRNYLKNVNRLYQQPYGTVKVRHGASMRMPPSEVAALSEPTLGVLWQEGKTVTLGRKLPAELMEVQALEHPKLVRQVISPKMEERVQAKNPTIGILRQEGDTILLGKKTQQVQRIGYQSPRGVNNRYFMQEEIQQKPYVLTRLSKMSQRNAVGNLVGDFAAPASRFKQAGRNENNLIAGQFPLQRSRSESVQATRQDRLQVQQQTQKQQQMQQEDTVQKTKMVQVHTNWLYGGEVTKQTGRSIPVETRSPIPTPIPPFTPSPPTPKPPTPPTFFTPIPKASGPQPKPQFGGWPSEGGTYNYPRQHGLFAFEEKLALITPGQMLSGMYGSKRKRALRKQIY